MANIQRVILLKRQHLQDDIFLANGLIMILDKIDIVPLLSYVNKYKKKISLSGICHYYKLVNKLISLSMLDRKRIVYSVQHTIFNIYNSFSTILISYLTLYNLYKVVISETPGKISAISVFSTEIDFNRAITAGILK